MAPRKSDVGRALVVEDDPAWRQIIGELLTDHGLVVDSAATSEAAIQCVRAHAHRLAVVDLALTEEAALNHEGLDVLAAIRRHDPGCKAILLSGYATVDLAVRALTEYGAFSCLEKAQFERARFHALVHKALAAVPPVSPEPSRLRSFKAVGQVSAGVEGKRGKGGAVLVVEDDAGWRDILQELLSEAGYTVRVCTGPGEAMGYLRREPFQVAVIDLSLSGHLWRSGAPVDRAGYHLLDAAREKGVATVVVSGVLTPEDVRRLYDQYQVAVCLEKQSFDRRAFLRAVEEALAAVRTARLPAGPLTAREIEVLQLLARGLTNKEIGEALVISPNTVKRHLRAIFDKLGVHTRAAAVSQAVSLGYVTEL